MVPISTQSPIGKNVIWRTPFIKDLFIWKGNTEDDWEKDLPPSGSVPKCPQRLEPRCSQVRSQMLQEMSTCKNFKNRRRGQWQTWLTRKWALLVTIRRDCARRNVKPKTRRWGCAPSPCTWFWNEAHQSALWVLERIQGKHQDSIKLPISLCRSSKYLLQHNISHHLEIITEFYDALFMIDITKKLKCKLNITFCINESLKVCTTLSLDGKYQLSRLL